MHQYSTTSVEVAAFESQSFTTHIINENDGEDGKNIFC